METRIIISRIFILAVVVLIGAMLAFADVGGLLRKFSLYLISFNRRSYSSQNVFVSTILSILTMPLLEMIINKFL